MWSPCLQAITADDALFSNVVSHVIDIGETKDFVFEVPYLRADLYSSTHALADNLTWETNGYLHVSIVTPLNYPTTPIPNIYMNVSVCAGDDFVLYRPDATYISTAEMNDVIAPHQAPGYVQSLVVTEKISIPDNICFGECTTSIKDLIMRPTNVEVITGPKTVEIDLTFPSSGSELNGSLLDYFKKFFRFSRGSTVMELYGSSILANVNIRNLTCLTKFPGYHVVQRDWVATDGTDLAGSGMYILPAATNNAISVRQPFNVNNYANPNFTLESWIPQQKPNDATLALHSLYCHLHDKILFSTHATAEVDVYVRAADDFVLSKPIGAPMTRYGYVFGRQDL
jgi:hypothetical protein